jgi:hypothetical protein
MSQREVQPTSEAVGVLDAVPLAVLEPELDCVCIEGGKPHGRRVELRGPVRRRQGQPARSEFTRMRPAHSRRMPSRWRFGWALPRPWR